MLSNNILKETKNSKKLNSLKSMYKLYDALEKLRLYSTMN